MITVEHINKYLASKNKPINTGYLLKDAGKGNFIAKWEVGGLAQPSKAILDGFSAAIASDKVTRDKQRSMKATAKPESLAGIIEELVDAAILSGSPLSQDTKDWSAKRKEIRG